ncbi:MAG: hypothetical protein FD166_2007 [Bacteroidetes bacterium]|nr:MAG: hypothetical protein FD166_2007 [Bacteroidota bacterium]
MKISGDFYHVFNALKNDLHDINNFLKKVPFYLFFNSDFFMKVMIIQ